MRKARTNVRSFLPHRKRRVTSAQLGLARGPRAVVLALVSAIPSGSAHPSEARWSRSRVAPALAASVVLHGIAAGLLLCLASLPLVRTDPDERIAVELVERPAASPLAQVEPSARSGVGPRQETRKQIGAPRRVPRSPQFVATSVPTPPAEKSNLLPASQSPFQEATPPATVTVPATNVEATNEAGVWVQHAAQASPAQAVPAANAEIEGRLRTATAGCYPYAAIRANLEGVTKLGFCVGERGMAGQVQIVQSSGSQLLDGAALDCVLPAAVPFPPAKNLCVTVPIRFQLRP